MGSNNLKGLMGGAVFAQHTLECWFLPIEKYLKNHS